jgi:hypothetical protein
MRPDAAGSRDGKLNMVAGENLSLVALRNRHELEDEQLPFFSNL